MAIDASAYSPASAGLMSHTYYWRTQPGIDSQAISVPVVVQERVRNTNDDSTLSDLTRSDDEA